MLGSLAGAANLLKGNTGVLREAQCEQKSHVEHRGKGFLDFDFQYSSSAKPSIRSKRKAEDIEETDKDEPLGQESGQEREPPSKGKVSGVHKKKLRVARKLDYGSPKRTE